MENDQSYEHATVFQRIVAFLIDHTFIIMSTMAIILLVAGDVFSGKASFLIIKIILAMLFCVIAYMGKDAVNGRSLGKRIVGIMVRDFSDHNIVPPIGRLFKRNLPVFFWPFEFLGISNDPNKQRSGDKKANTIVLQNPERPKILVVVISALFAFVAFIFAFIFLINTVIKNSEPYKISIRAIENDEDLKSEIGEIIGYGWMANGQVQTTNRIGNANFCITVKGSKKEKTVCTKLEKDKNKAWKLIEKN